MLWWASCGSVFASIILWGQVDVHPWASPFGCSALPHNVGRAFLPAGFPRTVGPGQSWVPHQIQWKNKELGDHSLGNPGHWQSREWEPGNGNHLLSLLLGKSGSFSCAFNLILVECTWPGYSGGEDLHQLTLWPTGVFQLPLPGCNPPFSWHFNCSISTYSAVPMQVTPILFFSSCSCWDRLKVILFLKEAVGELRWGHHIQGGPLPNESSQFSEVSSLVSLHHCQSWHRSCMFCEWSAHYCHATESRCPSRWHHSRI